MKEIRLFYAPNIAENAELPPEEAEHCLHVLRLQTGDEILLTDGKGVSYKAEITKATGKRCLFRVTETVPHPKEWSGHLHLALAPTKNMRRMEWLAEKATEIGFDELTFLECRHSERKTLNTGHIDRILVAAMKQSRKACKPLLNDPEDFRRFVARPFAGGKFVAHCHDEVDPEGKPFLLDVLDGEEDALVLVGPEGDFSVEEVRLAQDCGFRPVSLGRSRLRTETAALVAVHLMNISHTRVPR